MGSLTSGWDSRHPGTVPAGKHTCGCEPVCQFECVRRKKLTRHSGSVSRLGGLQGAVLAHIVTIRPRASQVSAVWRQRRRRFQRRGGCTSLRHARNLSTAVTRHRQHKPLPGLHASHRPPATAPAQCNATCHALPADGRAPNPAARASPALHVQVGAVHPAAAAAAVTPHMLR